MFFSLAAGELLKSDGALDQLAKEHKATMSQVAIAWLLHRSPVILPISETKVRHLEQNVVAAELGLDESEWHSLEEAAQKAA